MPERARVTSLEAIESFRAKLIIYRDKAGRLLDEVSDEVTRTRLWLQGDRRTYWQSQVERRARELQQRQQELFSAKLSTLSDSSTLQQAALRKAREALRDAESRLEELRNIFGVDGAVSAWDGKLLARVRAKDGFDLRKLLNPALKLFMPGGALPMIWSL